ncbi:MAG: HAD family hydrolase [Leptolyngbyaceae cyanobacterium SM2_3_12]|nr:HAD family hydrolase [Leptolyngbyaceae cyanobacterium SM2_3_12]
MRQNIPPPFAGTAVLLQRLGQSPIKIGLLSSDSTAQVGMFLDHYGLTNWFQAWRGTEPEDIPKPEPALLYQLCDRLQVNVSRTIVVGDSWVDLSLAQRAGAAAFLSVSEAWGRTPVAGATLILRHWDDLTVW